MVIRHECHSYLMNADNISAKLFGVANYLLTPPQFLPQSQVRDPPDVQEFSYPFCWQTW